MKKHIKRRISWLSSAKHTETNNHCQNQDRKSNQLYENPEKREHTWSNSKNLVENLENIIIDNNIIFVYVVDIDSNCIVYFQLFLYIF